MNIAKPGCRCVTSLIEATIDASIQAAMQIKFNVDHTDSIAVVWQAMTIKQQSNYNYAKSNANLLGLGLRVECYISKLSVISRVSLKIFSGCGSFVMCVSFVIVV